MPGRWTCWRTSEPTFAAVIPVAFGSSFERRASQPKRVQSRLELAMVFCTPATPRVAAVPLAASNAAAHAFAVAPDVRPLPASARLAEMVFAMAKPGDFVVCRGAGNITAWAAALPGELTELQARRIAGSAA